MPPIVLLGLGPAVPGMLSLDAVDRLSRAEDLFVDRNVDPSCWRGFTPASASVREVDGTDLEDQERTRQTMIACAGQGRRVVRARGADGWRCPSALRDVLAMRLAGLDIDIVPGLDDAAGSWRAWLASHPLYGRRILVTRMRDQASETAHALIDRGAEPWVMPTIELRPSPDPDGFRAALEQLSSYQVVAFTSSNGVDQTFAGLGSMGKDARAFGACVVAAIGTATAKALRDHGIRADVVAKEFRGEELATAILDRIKDLPRRRVLVPRARDAREVLPEMLRAAGCQVDVVAAYETVAPPPDRVGSVRDALCRGHIDAVLLTSSSTVRNLCSLLGEGYAEALAKTVLASIGPITSDTARQLGLEVSVEAEPFTIAGLITALERQFSR
jgi:uroporphyrinogen III methyltransferase/synthase